MKIIYFVRPLFEYRDKILGLLRIYAEGSLASKHAHICAGRDSFAALRIPLLRGGTAESQTAQIAPRTIRAGACYNSRPMRITRNPEFNAGFHLSNHASQYRQCRACYGPPSVLSAHGSTKRQAARPTPITAETDLSVKLPAVRSPLATVSCLTTSQATPRPQR